MPAAYSLGFVGDVMLGRGVDRQQVRRPPAAVWGDVHERLRGFDGLFGNLECCLSTRGTAWTRTRRAFHFRANPDWAVPALRAAAFDWLCLANNHVLDYEVVALRDTLDALSGADIPHAGAGETAAAAWAPSLVRVGDLEVAVVACTDNTPEYAADADSPGVAWTGMGLDEAADRAPVRGAIERARREDPDLLVASLHWGPNMVAEPDEGYVEFGHWLCEAGVDLVHGHSAHNFQGVEVHGDSLVLHDTGDLVDDYAVDRTLRNDRGFVFEVRLDAGGGLRELRLHPIRIHDYAAHEATGSAAAWCRERMRERSRLFGTAEALERAGEGLVLEV